MPFAPGKSGNPGGRPKEKLVRDTIRLVLKDGENTGTRRTIRNLMEVAIDKALNGDMQAMQFIAERLDGKVAQAVVGDDSEDAITIRQIVTGVPRAGE